ncbi:DinB family protein [Niabella aurantiaca]|uniref:DinB family protein n=1 Tax=Niabella aurantiaca TaxID=379900 RepID=UPI00036251FA|nr:DinB family protein [Niabella aurantiaca]
MQTVTVDTAQLPRDFTAAAEDFINLLRSVPADAFNRVPFEGSWSPAQVGDHVRKFLKGISGALTLPRSEPERAPDAHEPVLREIFLNFGKKATAPPFVVPSSGQIDRGQLMTALGEAVAEIAGDIGKKNLSMICNGAPFPTLGDMTGLEWVLFGTYHLRRHTHQLEQMQPYFNHI